VIWELIGVGLLEYVKVLLEFGGDKGLERLDVWIGVIIVILSRSRIDDTGVEVSSVSDAVDMRCLDGSMECWPADERYRGGRLVCRRSWWGWDLPRNWDWWGCDPSRNWDWWDCDPPRNWDWWDCDPPRSLIV
jgi:hypothetical protein